LLSTLHAIATGTKPAQGASPSLFRDGLAVVTGGAKAIATGAVEAEGAAAAAFLQGPAGVAAAGGHAVATGAVVPKGARSHFREGLHGLLGKG